MLLLRRLASGRLPRTIRSRIRFVKKIDCNAIRPVGALSTFRNEEFNNGCQGSWMSQLVLSLGIFFALTDRLESTCSESEHGGNELKWRLLQRLNLVRAGQAAAPSVRINSCDGDCQAISFFVQGKAIQAFSKFLAFLTKEHGRIIVAQNEDSDSVSLVFADGSGSVRIGSSFFSDSGHGNERDERIELSFFKESGDFSDAELDAFVDAYSLSALKRCQSDNLTESNSGIISRLESLGAVVYKAVDKLDWGALAGYEEVKREVEDAVLMGLVHAEEFNAVTRKTRVRFESNCPRAILFEGPPGVGKTLTARVVASVASVPLIYVPVEAVMSKWYGESESRLSEILSLCEQLENRAIVFLDEIDSLATSRETASASSMHEATRRLLSVLLRTLDGFEQRGNNASTLIAATNRAQDLDKALLSRFDVVVPFSLPSASARAEIFKLYAAQLSTDEIEALAKAAQGFSGRDIKDTCKHAERRWVSHCIRQSKRNVETPPFEIYKECLTKRACQLLL